MVNRMTNDRKKRIAIVLSLVLCFMMALCGCKGSPEEEPAPAEETQSEGLDSLYGDESLGIDAAVDEQLKDYRLIALFGIDDGDHNDIAMIISVNKTDNTAKIVSIVRDSYMQVSEAKDDEAAIYERCNVGYQWGGKYNAMKILNRNLDLNIRECICVDWQCAADLVDTLGGLTVTVDEGMREGINKLLPDDNKIEQSGEQTLNGWQAVQYLRVRKYKGGDTIARVNNNQEVFLQLYNQAKSMSTSEIAAVYDKIADELDTNMSRNTLTDTLAQISSVDIETTDNWPYEWKRMKGKSNEYRVPVSLDSNVKELHKKLFGQEDYQPSNTVQEISAGIKEKESILKELG